MKKFTCLMLCVVFLLCAFVPSTFCLEGEDILFTYGGKEFSYSLLDNFGRDGLFCSEDKFNRFGGKSERKKLLQRIISLGFGEDVCVNYLFPNLENTLTKIEKTINVKPKDAVLHKNANTTKVFSITKERVGVKVDKQQLYSQICKNYLEGKLLKIEIKTISLSPQVLSTDFECFSNLRADFSTDISSSNADRKHNIKNALASLNFVEILPDCEFSFNKTVGRRTQENGYRTAKIIVNNEFTEGLGGGVCQVSSTLYNAALLAGLEIKEANKHSKQVGYVKFGFDAMVNFGSSDLKFINNTKEKIIIVTNYSPTTARIRIFGESLGGVKYKLKNEIVSCTEPKEIVEFDTKQEHLDKVVYEDESFLLKKGTRGMEVKSFREKYVDGKLVATEKLRFDKFQVQDAVRIFGTKKRTENPCAFA